MLGRVSRSAEHHGLRSTALGFVGAALVVLGLVLTFANVRVLGPSDRAITASSSRAARPTVGHVFVINIENKGFRQTWGPRSAAPYLAKTLRRQGVLLTRYYGTAHHSLGNYLAQISGQGPTHATQYDCPTYTSFRTTRADAGPGQVVGSGCVYPARVKTLVDQLQAAGLSWRGYMQDMRRGCQHPALGHADPWYRATTGSQYATRHNPFVYFRSITSRPHYCRTHDVGLQHLTHDLRHVGSTRALSYITPDLCHDGHDPSCADGGPGGLRAVDNWMREWVPRILHSPAFRKDGILVITADESEGMHEDSRACCGEGGGPNAREPGIEGPGGGRIGALVLSRYVAPGTTSDRGYNHYSLLASIEDLFGLSRLGYARTVPRTFGADVFTGR